MPSSLLASQLATLEPLQPDEAGVVIDNQGCTPEQLAARIVAKLPR
jgi:gluconokinase